jgi:hypothetical protein
MSETEAPRDESTGQFAPTEPLFGKAAAERDAGYTPLPDEAKAEAEELDEKLAAEQIKALSGPESAIVTYTSGLPDDVTMTLEQGAAAVADAREADRNQAEIDETKALQKEVDEKRGDLSEFEAHSAAAKEGDTEPDIEKALAHPKIKAALDQRITETETQREAYSKAVETANTFARASLTVNFPEIAALPLDQWERALEAMAVREPDRFAKFTGTLNQVAQLEQAAAQQQQQKTAREAAEFKRYAAQENERFAKLTANESKETMRAVEAHVPKMLAEHGADVRQFLEAVSNQSTFPRATAEALLVKAAKYDLLMKAPKPVASRAEIPPVMRPGVSARIGAAERNAASLESLNSRLNKSGSLKDAAALLQARRKGR